MLLYASLNAPRTAWGGGGPREWGFRYSAFKMYLAAGRKHNVGQLAQQEVVCGTGVSFSRSFLWFAQNDKLFCVCFCNSLKFIP